MIPLRIISRILIVTLAFSLLVGCAENSPQKKPQQSDVEVVFETEVAQHAKQLAKGVDGVEQSTSVVINQEVGTAIEVTGFDRWRLKSIREEVYKKIKEAYPDYEVHVTSDKKLFWQLQQIEKEIEEDRIESPVGVKDRFDKINENMGG